MGKKTYYYYQWVGPCMNALLWRQANKATKQDVDTYRRNGSRVGYIRAMSGKAIKSKLLKALGVAIY
ncbi:MAG: hypothetical protein ACOYOV_00285 [Bacteroidales bacterium]